jgi:hypothetical protein
MEEKKPTAARMIIIIIIKDSSVASTAHTSILSRRHVSNTAATTTTTERPMEQQPTKSSLMEQKSHLQQPSDQFEATQSTTCNNLNISKRYKQQHQQSVGASQSLIEEYDEGKGKQPKEAKGGLVVAALDSQSKSGP